ncbi:uncharacterized protein LOC121403883 [Drosophila obscura]|uniref:uncharacterized protein LOC121403883 n=1 Tax=Drosophila obscura TaxID=7282 RepID=UPI001BB26009|nr:uncharacterized protein LOC121403883 [Drosophila obscura]
MNPEIACTMCSEFVKLTEFASHYDSCVGPRIPIECNLCYKSLEGTEIDSHYESCLGPQKKVECDLCLNFLDLAELDSHYESTSRSSKRPRMNAPAENIDCAICGESYTPSKEKRHIMSEKHKNAAADQIHNNPNIINLASNSKFPIKSYRVQSSKSNRIDLKDFYNDCKNDIINLLNCCLSEYRAVKFNLKVYGLYVKQTDDETLTETMKHFITSYKPIYEQEFIDEHLNNALENLITLSSEFQEKDSGWAIKNFKYFELTIIKLEHIPARGYIEAPKKIKSRNAIINVKNVDDFCFKWCILASLAYKRHAETTFTRSVEKRLARDKLAIPSSYRILNINQEIIHYNGFRLDFSEIEFPITSKGIKRFEKANEDFSINIYEIDDNGKNVVGPTVRTNKIRPNHINLLGINSDMQMMHYAYITCMKKLCYSQHSKSHSAAYFCDNCLQFYSTTNTIHDTKECGKVAALYPEPNTKTIFKSWSKKLSPPVVIYADIEAVLENFHRNLNDPSKSSTTMAQRHTACAVSFYVAHKYNPHLNEMWTYEGPDCIEKFCQVLRAKTDGLYEKYWKSSKKPIYEFNIWDEDCQEHEACCACDEQILVDDREKYFNQFTGQYVGPIHKVCKQTFRLSDPFFPVVCHNLSRYDIHLFVTSIRDELKPIPCNKELYIALTQTCKLDSHLHQYKIRYIDSNRFLNSSLEKLASYMDVSNFKILNSKYQNEKFDMLRRKGVFPYDYLDSFQKFEESQLPSREYFYNSLNDEECSVEDYNFAQSVWRMFNCTSIRDYLKLYLESDVLILPMYSKILELFVHEYTD